MGVLGIYKHYKVVLYRLGRVTAPFFIAAYTHPIFFKATDDGLVPESFWKPAGSRHLPPTHDGALLDWRLPPGVRSSYGPVAAVLGALGGPAVGARATGCAYSRLPPHATLPFVGSF